MFLNPRTELDSELGEEKGDQLVGWEGSIVVRKSIQAVNYDLASIANLGGFRVVVEETIIPNAEAVVGFILIERAPIQPKVENADGAVNITLEKVIAVGWLNHFG